MPPGNVTPCVIAGSAPDLLTETEAATWADATLDELLNPATGPQPTAW
jgi:hypothetical protein